MSEEIKNLQDATMALFAARPAELEIISDAIANPDIQARARIVTQAERLDSAAGQKLRAELRQNILSQYPLSAPLAEVAVTAVVAFRSQEPPRGEA